MKHTNGMKNEQKANKTFEHNTFLISTEEKWFKVATTSDKYKTTLIPLKQSE